jgi:hypothetical protein
MSVSVDSLQSKLAQMKAAHDGPGTVTVSVSELKQRLGVGAGVRLVIEPDSGVPVVEAVQQPTAVRQAVVKPVAVKQAVLEEAVVEQAGVEETAPTPPSTANNVFMKRNVRVRQWGVFTDPASDRKISSENAESLWGGAAHQLINEEAGTTEGITQRGPPTGEPTLREDARPGQAAVLAKQAAAVDSLKKKLE